MSPRPWNAAQCTMLPIHQHPHDPAPRFQQRQQQRRGQSADIGRLNCYPSSKLGWNPSSIARGRCPRHHYPQYWSRSVGLPLDSGPLCPLALWVPLCRGRSRKVYGSKIQLRWRGKQFPGNPCSETCVMLSF